MEHLRRVVHDHRKFEVLEDVQGLEEGDSTRPYRWYRYVVAPVIGRGALQPGLYIAQIFHRANPVLSMASAMRATIFP